MIVKNVRVYTEQKKFVPGTIYVRDGFIWKVALEEEQALSGQEVFQQEILDQTVSWEGKTADETVIDGEGCYCFPGMIDLHFHGCKGYDVCDGTREAIEEIAKYEASIGVTAISPATMTLPVSELENILSNAADFRKEQKNKAGITEYQMGADLVGINMEGPFISKVKKGAQDEKNIISCDVEIYRRFQKAADGLVKFIGIAPEETEDAEAFIKDVKEEVTVSLAHTNADYETAKKAYDAGASHAVHLYNAMPSYSHRAPGVIGAVVDSEHVMAELICDGVHIHPAAVRTTFKMLGGDRIILISDSMRAAGMPDGQYTLGGLDVSVKGNRAVLVSDGALAGSVTTLPNCVRTVVKKMGIPLETAIACATINPAKSLKIDKFYGTIAPGKKADLVLWDDELNLKNVIKDGKILR